MTCSGLVVRSSSSIGRIRSTRSPSAMTTFGAESARPYFISSVVHHAFMPTTRRADRHDRPVAEHPFGVVAHRDRHAVARTDAVDIAQVMRERADDGIGLGVRVALVLVDDVVAVTERRRQLPHEAHRRQRRFEDLDRHVAHRDLLDRELRTRRRQLVPGLCVLFDHHRHVGSVRAGAPNRRPNPRATRR